MPRVNKRQKKASEMLIKHSLFVGEHADRIAGSLSWQPRINYNRSMPADLKLSQIGSSPLAASIQGTSLSRSKKT